MLIRLDMVVAQEREESGLIIVAKRLDFYTQYEHGTTFNPVYKVGNWFRKEYGSSAQ